MKKYIIILFSLFCVGLSAQDISLSDTINTGSAPGSGDGDLINVSFTKSNSFFKSLLSFWTRTDSIVDSIPQNTSDLNNDAGFLTTEVDGSISNELQTLSIDGNDLSISDGNTIAIPSSGGGSGDVSFIDTLPGEVIATKFEVNSLKETLLDTIHVEDTLMFKTDTGNIVPSLHEFNLSRIPSGGAIGQILAKINGISYNTEWVDAATSSSSGSGGVINILQYIIGYSTNAPSAGDSIITHAAIDTSEAIVYRNGLRVYYTSILDSILTIRPPYVNNDTMIVELRSEGSYNLLTLKDTSTTSVVNDPENLILQSERLNVIPPWVQYQGFTIDSNQALDCNGDSTLEALTATTTSNFHYQEIEDLSASTTYVASIEASGSDTCNVWRVVVEDVTGGTELTLTSNGSYSDFYGSSVTTSPQRFSYEFTTGSGLTGNIRISTAATDNATCNNKTINVGRIHVYEGEFGDKTYTTTTTIAVP